MIVSTEERTKMKYRVPLLGKSTLDSPLGLSSIRGDCVANFVPDNKFIVIDTDFEKWKAYRDQHCEPEVFELAGPRNRLFFNPSGVRAAIVTCGGLCPGLNDVIRALVMSLHYRYGVDEILGIRYGFKGMTLQRGGTAIPLKPDMVENIHNRGGSFLGSSRGPQDVVEMVDFLQRRQIQMLFTIGGDGTIKGSVEIARECKKRELHVSVIGIPKTIDNDIAFIDRSFGFSSAVAKAKEVIDSAHVEARGVPFGIGLVKLMGRHSGYIAARAALASGETNFVLVPEVPFDLSGERGLLKCLENRLVARNHALIVVAEGAGQAFMTGNRNKDLTDSSGNIRLADIGLFLKEKIESHFSRTEWKTRVKYFDPSYLIRATTANADDSVFCYELAENAVHAAFAGRTRTIVATWQGHFVHIPMELTISKRKQLNPDGPEWLAVMENTGQTLMRNSVSD
jgi:6-phosphofructokinase 1